METHEDLRSQLTQELDGLLRRQERLEDHLHNRSREVPDDWAERAALNSGEEVVEALDARTKARIHELRTALAHMDEPTWGQCTGCGEAIPLKRLAALPTTRLCLGCAA